MQPNLLKKVSNKALCCWPGANWPDKDQCAWWCRAGSHRASTKARWQGAWKWCYLMEEKLGKQGRESATDWLTLLLAVLTGSLRGARGWRLQAQWLAMWMWTTGHANRSGCSGQQFERKGTGRKLCSCRTKSLLGIYCFFFSPPLWEPMLFLLNTLTKQMASWYSEEKLEKPLKRKNLCRKSGFGRCTAHQMRRCRWAEGRVWTVWNRWVLWNMSWRPVPPFLFWVKQERTIVKICRGTFNLVTTVQTGPMGIDVCKRLGGQNGGKQSLHICHQPYLHLSYWRHACERIDSDRSEQLSGWP